VPGRGPLARMQSSGNGRLMVTRAPRLVGVVSLKDMMKLLALRMDLGDAPRPDRGPQGGATPGEGAARAPRG